MVAEPEKRSMNDAAPLEQEKMMSAAMRLLTENPLYKVIEAEIRGATYRVFENAPAHLPEFFEKGAAHGDRDFLLFDDEKLSFAETWTRARRLAHALRAELGVRQGDHVAIAMRNYPEWCVAYMAVISLGAVVVPLNAWWKGHELRYGIEDSGAKIVFVDGRRLGYLAPMKGELGLTLILARDEGDGADFRFDALVDLGGDDTPLDVSIRPDDDFCIVYTSGSTGHPKGVVLTHRGCISGLMSWSFVSSVVKAARGGASIFGENPGVLLAIPLFHVTGSHCVFLLSYMVGRRVAMMRRWDADEAVQVINKHQLTNFIGVPSQSFELMQAAGENGLPSLIDIAAGGAKRPPEHVRKLTQNFRLAKPSAGYGLSETNAVGCVISLDDYQKRPDSTGRALAPLTDIKIMKDGAETPRGEVGEIWIRSPANFRGYHNLPEDTVQALTPDGWFKTGDLGKMDAEDYVYVVDRVKDLIIRGGENVSCLEVENRVYEHDAVAEASVFSVPDETLGERVGLVVYPKRGATIEARALRDFIGAGLAEFKTPERIWISPAPLPRLGTAKFDKIMVRKIALQHDPALSL